MSSYAVGRGLRPWSLATAIGAALIAGYFALPRESLTQAIYYNAITLAFVALIAVGVRMHRPADRLTWELFALGVSVWMSGDVVSTVYLGLDGDAPFPSIGDVLYLAAYPILFVAVARMGRRATAYIARERRLDGLIVALAALVLSWQPLMQSYASDSTLTLVGKLTLIAYPVMDIALLFVLVTAMVFGGRREPVDLLVCLSFTVMLFGDFAYDLLELHGSYADGDLIDITWLASYLLLGVAALHPSMASEQTVPPNPTPRSWWVTMVAVAWLVPAACLLAYTAIGADINVVVISALALVMAGLATLRMKWMVQAVRDRSRRLQEALRERDKLERDLRHRAFHDPLTGVANRVLLRERIEHALARASREGGLVALIMCDLDGFKIVNDSLGHQTGDQLLMTAARRLTGVVRPGDTVARIGGDEFAALLDDVADTATAQRIAERMVAALHEAVHVGGEQLRISTSAGVVVGRAGCDPDDLISDADAALYEAKSNGKNRHVLFAESMRTRARERLQITNAFIGAIERGEFRVEYQPCFSLAGGLLRNFEAQLRWDHPTLGVLPPAQFLSLAEETGFIRPLGRWMLETACAAAAAWPARVDGSPTVAVDLSARQLSDRRLPGYVRRALEASGLPGPRLVLEITESMFIVDKARTIRVLDELRHMGVRIAIDDFGMGYSSLSELRDLPVDFVKIDKTFVEQISTDARQARSVLDAILRLARDLELTTVAAGIELEAQHEMLSDMGCDNGQGVLLCRPLDRHAATALASRAATGAGPPPHIIPIAAASGWADPAES